MVVRRPAATRNGIMSASFLAACAQRHLLVTDLPDEVLLLILRCGVAVESVLSCAATCKQLSTLTTNECLWRFLCERSWPLIATARHAPAMHLCALPPESWRELHHSRVAGVGAGWGELLPMYDQSTWIATERQPGWIVALGSLLLRIERTRMLHGLPSSPAHSEREQSDILPQHSEAVCWARTLQHELLVGFEEVAAFAGDPGAAEEIARLTERTVAELHAESIGGKLDAWRELVEASVCAPIAAAKELRADAEVAAAQHLSPVHRTRPTP